MRPKTDIDWKSTEKYDTAVDTEQSCPAKDLRFRK